jgi:hypothetical protein
MHCCSEGDTASPAISAPSSATASWLRRIGAFIQWSIPITTLALIPKCPGCVAGYVLLFTGIGVSFTTATALRWSLIAFSIAVLAYLVFRTARRAFALSARHA